jgi:hypothetical protein
LLDAAAIERVREQAWPYVNSSDELHAAISSLAYMTEQEFDDKEYSSLVQPLLDSARVVSARLSHNKSLIWVATESVPRLAVLFPMILTDNKLPEFLVQQKWESELYPARIDSYDPGWLDVMCISGGVAWGRYSLPAASQRKLQQNLKRKRSAGPIKSTPISLVSRQNIDIWQALANALGAVSSENSYSALAAKIEIDLEKHGASFFDQVQTRSGLLKTHREEGLAELVHAGRITSGNFTGLRALLTPNSKKSSTHRRRHRGAMFGVEDAGRWSLLNTFSFPETKTQAGTGMF